MKNRERFIPVTYAIKRYLRNDVLHAYIIISPSSHKLIWIMLNFLVIKITKKIVSCY